MSKNSKNILGNQQGKIGNIVGRVVNGVQIYSAYGGKGHDPRTPKQIATRAKFSAITLLSNILCGPIAVGFRRTAAAVPMTSPRNIFVKRNFALMQYDAETGIVTPDYEHIVVSDGRVLSVAFATPSFAEAASITVTFTPDEVILRGAGWGHGVGLCQIGAAVMSAKGYDYRQILQHYYPGHELKTQ